MRRRHWIWTCAPLLACAGAPLGCGEDSDALPVIDRAMQESSSIEFIIEQLKAGNRAFAAGKSTPFDDRADARALAKGQFPVTAFVDFIDSRLAPDWPTSTTELH